MMQTLRRWSISKAIHIAAVVCVPMHIAPVKRLFEDFCAHIGYSICFPIVGAMNFDCNNDYFQYLRYVLKRFDLLL